MNHLRVTVVCKGYHQLVNVFDFQPGAHFSRLIWLNVQFVSLSHEIVASCCRSIYVDRNLLEFVLKKISSLLSSN